MSEDFEIEGLSIFGLREQSGAMAIARALVDEVNSKKETRKLVYKALLQPHSGDAFLLKAGQIIRLEQHTPEIQVVDWMFITPDLKQWADMGMSILFSGQYLSKYYQVMSNSSPMEPLAIMCADEAPVDFAPKGWSRHFWGHHCSPELHQTLVPGTSGHANSCHVNFTQAVSRIPAIAAIEDQEHRKLMVSLFACHSNFQTFQLQKNIDTEDGNHISLYGSSPNVPIGTGVEFYVTKDVYVLCSSCPGGSIDLDAIQKGEGHMETAPIELQVWDPGVPPKTIDKWNDSIGPFYDRVAKGEIDITPRTSQASYRHGE